MDENSLLFKFRRFIQESIRVLKVTKKPDKTEYTTIVKMSGLGMIIIGMVGFTISMLKILIFNT
ncbi:protein translocase SEC61 complex subunit gamma [Candidatus Pacearchaeota archaeon]|nr:protein translocase SEC61 complex subunit gamma [Candidatus Pacearchaeota archaeon]